MRKTRLLEKKIYAALPWTKRQKNGQKKTDSQ